MKKSLIENYWFMIISWSLFLNDYVVLGCLLSLLGCYLLLRKRKVDNLYKVLALSLLTYEILSFSLQFTNIPYFFANIKIFLLSVCANAFIVNDYIYIFKEKVLRPIGLMMIIAFMAFIITIAFLPSSLYTMFSKTSLVLLTCFIFLPYIVPMMVCIISKYVRIHTKKEANIISF